MTGCLKEGRILSALVYTDRPDRADGVRPSLGVHGLCWLCSMRTPNVVGAFSHPCLCSMRAGIQMAMLLRFPLLLCFTVFASNCALDSGNGVVELDHASIEGVSYNPVRVAEANTSDGGGIWVYVKCESYDEAKHGLIRMDGSLPERALVGLWVFIDSGDGEYRDVSPPKEEIDRFGDPRYVRIEEAGDLLFVYIEGGDGAGSHGRRLVYGQPGYFCGEYHPASSFE